MNRRHFIALVGTGVAVWSLSAQAQQSGKVWRIGFIAHKQETFYESLFGRLRELGFEEGRNLIIERRLHRAMRIASKNLRTRWFD